MKIRPRLLVMFFCLCLGQVSAIGAPMTDQFTAADYEFFERRIRPILVHSCYECHSAGAKKLKGGLRLDSRPALLNGGDSGPAVVPGKVKESLLVIAVDYGDEDLQMPPKGKLPDREIALLSEWIKRGAPMPASKESGSIKRDTIDFEAGRQFWSFQPTRPQPLPPVKDPSWNRQRIDAFALAEMDQHGLNPSASASRHDLIRRATFDLIGLPPTPDEVQVFVADDSPDAYSRLIDRLLASPQHGERWGRFWLDLARYTDTTASWLKSTGQAYLYRDWVVGVLNDDLPYDQFVMRQLATDMMPETGPDDIPALGLLGLSPTYWKELKLAPDVIRTVVAEEWEERIDTVGRTFLGLTVACARCHDHKFDPISQEDYYALAGVFASVRLADRAIIPDDQAKLAQEGREKLKSLENQIEILRKKKPSPDEGKKKISELEAEIAAIRQSTPHIDTPLANVVEEAGIYVLPDGPDKTKIDYKPGQPRNIAMQIRGNPANPGPIVPRRFLTVLSSTNSPPPFERGSGRLELASAIVHEAAPLAARVIVNRVWAYHFGRGLVTTPSNFGSQGTRPSHPQLLDDLAARFTQNGWSLKWLHREIMLSATYQQSSKYDNRQHAIDPDNRWLWRMNRRRLEIEAWRDSMLAVAGNLDRRIGGPPIDLTDANNHRRTIYAKIHRRDLNQMLRMHDFPDPTGHSPKRDTTTTPLQQLFVLNSDFMQQQACALSMRLRQDESSEVNEQLYRAHQLLFARQPTSKQLQFAVEFLTASDSSKAPTDELWQQYAQVLLGSNQFLFID